MKKSLPPRPISKEHDAAEDKIGAIKGSLSIVIPQIAAEGAASPRPTEASERVQSDLFANLKPGSFAGHDWNPYSDEDSNILIGQTPEKRVKLDDLLTHVLAPIGYVRVDKLIYRGLWSTPEVEHILSISTYGNPKIALTGDAGVRNIPAMAFARQCRERYGNKTALRALKENGYVDPPWYCPSHFSIGSYFGWKPRSSLYTVDLSPDQLTREVLEPIQSKLIPFLHGITSSAQFLACLERDEEPLRWRGGENSRAALVAYLAAKLGVPMDRTRHLLLSHAKYMSNAIDTIWLTPETYIDKILDDAQTAASQSTK